jgi:hypothetical protein
VGCWQATISHLRHVLCWSAPITMLPRGVVAGHRLPTTSLSRWPGPTSRRRPPALGLPAGSQGGLVVPSRPCATGSLPPATVATCQLPALVAAAPPLVPAWKAGALARMRRSGEIVSLSGY